jgi:hypothetical protein
MSAMNRADFRFLRAGGLVAGVMASGLAHAAVAPTSRYTKVDLKPPACRRDPGPAEGFSCIGLGGWGVSIGFPAIGASIAIARSGRLGSRDLDARDGRSLVVEGLSASTSIIEWRGAVRGGRFEPTAAILRVSVLDASQRQEMIESGGPPLARPRRSQVLIVYRLGPKGACHIAYVDAGMNPNANDLAREAADAPTACPVDRVAVPGRSSPILDGNIR